MSYARFSHSDVYVFLHVDGGLECCGCLLQEVEWIDEPGLILGGYLKRIGEIVPHRFDSTQGMVDHLALHRAAGHDVPDGIDVELWADDIENFGLAR